MAKRPDYQNLNDDLEEITDRRNAEIRAWGKKVLADADAVLVESWTRGTDWDQVDEEVAIAPAPVESNLKEAVKETEISPEPTPNEPVIVPVVEEPKTPKPRTPKATATS